MTLPDREPTAAELAAIEAEWPLIAAELAVTDAEAALVAGCGGELGRARLTAARRRLATVAAGFEPAGLGLFRPRPVAAPWSRVGAA